MGKYNKIDKRTIDWGRMHGNFDKADATHGYPTNIISLNKQNQFNRIKEEIDFNKYEKLSFIEIGPGDSGLCKLILSEFQVDRYVLVDDLNVLSVARNNLSPKGTAAAENIQFVPIEDLDTINKDSFNIFLSFNCMAETPLEYQDHVYSTFFPRCDEVFISDRWDGEKFGITCGQMRTLLNKHLDSNFSKYSDKKGLPEARDGQWIIHGWGNK